MNKYAGKRQKCFVNKMPLKKAVLEISSQGLLDSSLLKLKEGSLWDQVLWLWEVREREEAATTLLGPALCASREFSRYAEHELFWTGVGLAIKEN